MAGILFMDTGLHFSVGGGGGGGGGGGQSLNIHLQLYLEERVLYACGLDT